MYLMEYRRRSILERGKIRIGWHSYTKVVSDGLVRECARFKPDCVWVDQGLTLSSEAIEAVRSAHRCALSHYTPDSLSAPGMSLPEFRRALGHYDICFTTKEVEVEVYQQLGARKIVHTFQAFDPDVHRPVALTREDQKAFRSDVSFVGQYMKRRAQMLANLVERGLCTLGLYGRQWERGATGRVLGPIQRGWMSGDDYAKALCGSKMGLCMLNVEVNDQHTSRTFEIPACRTMMLAERTPTHERLFKEDKEAVFFGSAEELCDKVRFYLGNPVAAANIASNGYNRVMGSGYTWQSRMIRCKRMIEGVPS